MEVEKTKRVMSAEQLEKLAKARERANEVRKSKADEKREIKQKQGEIKKAEIDEIKNIYEEKVVKKRLPKKDIELIDDEPEPVKYVQVIKAKPKRKPKKVVYIESSSSESEEDEIIYKKKKKTRKPKVSTPRGEPPASNAINIPELVKSEQQKQIEIERLKLIRNVFPTYGYV